MFFRAASALSFSYSSDGILIFSARSFTVPPPYYNYTTIYVACQEVFWKTSLKTQGRSDRIDLSNLLGLVKGAHLVFARDSGRSFYLPSSSSAFSSNHWTFVFPCSFSFASRASTLSRFERTQNCFMIFRRSRKYSARLSGATVSPPCSVLQAYHVARHKSRGFSKNFPALLHFEKPPWKLKAGLIE